jgi:hypothetical protein
MLKTMRLSVIQFFSKRYLRKEITLIILIKLILLFLLWTLFVSNAHLDKAKIINHFTIEA